MLTIACVLKTGGDYKPAHVEHLRQSVDLFAQKWKRTRPLRFVCLSDEPGLIEGSNPHLEVLTLMNNWPGWWSKLELFRAFASGEHVLYFDLDTEIVGDLTPVFERAVDLAEGQIIALEDFFRGEGSLQSSVMAWKVCEPISRLYGNFSRNPDSIMQAIGGGGDQIYIEHQAKAHMHFIPWQLVMPGSFCSYKLHAFEALPPGTRVVCFHGQPRPWDVSPIWGRLPWTA